MIGYKMTITFLIFARFYRFDKHNLHLVKKKYLQTEYKTNINN